jgi:hypothetical protein
MIATTFPTKLDIALDHCQKEAERWQKACDEASGTENPSADYADFAAGMASIYRWMADALPVRLAPDDVKLLVRSRDWGQWMLDYHSNILAPARENLEKHVAELTKALTGSAKAPTGRKCLYCAKPIYDDEQSTEEKNYGVSTTWHDTCHRGHRLEPRS